MADVAQLVRASVCGTECREFESHHPPQFKPPEMGGFFVVPLWLEMSMVRVMKSEPLYVGMGQKFGDCTELSGVSDYVGVLWGAIIVPTNAASTFVARLSD